MKKILKIINDTIVDHNGHKRSTLMILGDPENGYVQGTILDANAVAEEVDKVSNSTVNVKELQELTEAEKAIARTNIGAAKESVDIGSIIEITYEELRGLWANDNLIPGMRYRIIDYVTTTALDNTQSAGHQFDLIVTADDVNVLNENARAALHSGDTYFADSKLESWELKYCLYNDTTRFAWADSTNGKGVIYYMKDEFGNECPYDFKNIQYVFKKSFKIHSYYGSSYYGVYNSTNETVTINDVIYYKQARISYIPGPFTPPQYVWTTVTTYTTDMVLYDISGETVTTLSYTIFNVSNNEFNTFTFDQNGIEEASKIGQITKVYNNIIRAYYNNGIQQLNVIYFRSTSATRVQAYNNVFGTGCYSNSFGCQCYNNSFGYQCNNNSFGNYFYDNSFDNECHDNSFDNECHDNTFGNRCNNNTFGNNCNNNTFGNSCGSNSFGNYCRTNTFGDSCSSNSFGNSCDTNSFDNSCSSNSFGNECHNDSFGNNCSSNSFGNYFYNNSFGNNCVNNSFGNNCRNNTFGNYCGANSFGKDYTYYVIIENGNKFITLTSTQTTSSNNSLQNITIAQGYNNTSTSKTITHDTVNDTFKTTYQATGSQIITQ